MRARNPYTQYRPPPRRCSIDERQRSALDQPCALFYGWQRGWDLPDLATRLDDAVSISTEPLVGLLARLADLEESEVERRLKEHNQVFLVRVAGEPAAYGWSAAGPAHIGGLSLAFDVAGRRALPLDFVTLPAFQARSCTPPPLQAILRRQSAEAEWFWIGHGQRNAASRRGYRRQASQPGLPGLVAGEKRRADIYSAAAEANPDGPPMVAERLSA